jgi:thiamine-monophosphate kinase
MARRTSEFDLIERFFAPLAAAQPGALGLRDDAAILKPEPGFDLVITADAIVEGIHFLAESPPGDVARRILRVNLSDLAAKGARPLAYTLTIQLPLDRDEAWIEAFTAALGEDQKHYAVTLLGGDTSRTDGPLTLSVNMFGQVAENKMIYRSGAQPDDDVYVSGTIGDAVLGLAVERGTYSPGNAEQAEYLAKRFRRPEPRLALGRGLVGRASAGADVSDGLIADLGHICRASGIAADIDISAVPLSEAARNAVTDDQPLHLSLLAGGDDYELVFTAPKAQRAAIEAAAADAGISVTRIGRTRTADPTAERVLVRDGNGNRLEVKRGGYRHFEEE